MHIRPRSCGALSSAMILLAAMVGVCVLGACGGPSKGGRAPRVEARRKAFPIPHESFSKLGYRLDWTGFPVLRTREGVRFIEAYDDIVVVQEAGSTVTVLEATNGSQRWSDQLATPLSKFVGLSRAGDVIYASGEAELFVLDARTGNVMSRQRYDKIVATRPVKHGNLFVYGTVVGELLAHLSHSAVDGVKAWGYDVEGAIEADPVAIGPTVGAVSQNGRVGFVDIASGALVGRNRIYKGLDTDPVADETNRIMFVASLDQSIYAFAADGGSLLWRHRTAHPLRQQPTFHNGRLYCGVDGGLAAFDGATGDVVWTAEGVSGTVIAMSKGRLLVWDGHTATLLDPERGDTVDQVKLDGVKMIKPDHFDGGNLYVVSNSGVVAKLAPK